MSSVSAAKYDWTRERACASSRMRASVSF